MRAMVSRSLIDIVAYGCVSHLEGTVRGKQVLAVLPVQKFVAWILDLHQEAISLRDKS